MNPKPRSSFQDLMTPSMRMHGWLVEIAVGEGGFKINFRQRLQCRI
jgi:hypothetical protein